MSARLLDPRATSHWGKHDLLIAGDVRVRAFRCWGEKRPFVSEDARDATAEPGSRATADPRGVALELPQRGAHLRAYGRETFVVDVTTVAILPADAEYLRGSPSDAPQTSTLVTLSGELAERLARAKSRLPISRASARAHQALLASETVLERHESAIALVEAISVDAGEPSAGATSRPLSAAWKQLARQVQYLVATRYAEGLSLDAIASACGVSPFHAARVFRSVTGRTIHQHLVRVRIHHALYELSHGAGALTDVALRTGFSSHSHLTSTFRRLMGVPPRVLASNPRARRVVPIG